VSFILKNEQEHNLVSNSFINQYQQYQTPLINPINNLYQLDNVYSKNIVQKPNIVYTNPNQNIQTNTNNNENIQGLLINILAQLQNNNSSSTVTNQSSQPIQYSIPNIQSIIPRKETKIEEKSNSNVSQNILNILDIISTVNGNDKNTEKNIDPRNLYSN
jgi:hypothetical protein